MPDRMSMTDFGVELDRQLKELQKGVDDSAHYLSTQQGFKAINARLDRMQAQIDALADHLGTREAGREA